ncbi:hypothetical protein M409DRAFT_29617 [Zasmidium cellare ATCC 36951]|uniref:Uncharacterized protein n=1 Tax=Zasmidium cellare ATCC 36951 TaxID=1080233 RepID=A0A6A6BYY5_ZASCE|nr:uncharacterized protein M409DRAFT_29617 [Zasmidium cellare ATCC 36951]KAF2160007.1 hypothetical protein M409DRAFT_29617 [Zasmidium cellare ATCC 36951]
MTNPNPSNSQAAGQPSTTPKALTPLTPTTSQSMQSHPPFRLLTGALAQPIPAASTHGLKPLTPTCGNSTDFLSFRSESNQVLPPVPASSAAAAEKQNAATNSLAPPSEKAEPAQQKKRPGGLMRSMIAKKFENYSFKK